MPCSLVERFQHFWGTCYLCLKGTGADHAQKWRCKYTEREWDYDQGYVRPVPKNGKAKHLSANMVIWNAARRKFQTPLLKFTTSYCKWLQPFPFLLSLYPHSCFPMQRMLLPWRWRQQVYPKCYFLLTDYTPSHFRKQSSYSNETHYIMSTFLY
jgi:hypothetical protein